jgi:hypothetical protein
VTRYRTHSHPAVVLATVIAVVLAAFGAGLVVLLFVGGRSFFEIGTSERRHLDEIPIDRADACDNVEAIHAALDSFSSSYMAASLGISQAQWDALRRPTASSSVPPAELLAHQPPWPMIAADVDASATRLDLVLADGIPHLPARLRQELAVVRQSIAEGRRQLPKAHDFGELEARTGRAFDRGKLHAGYASDLVGDQCSVPLGA